MTGHWVPVVYGRTLRADRWWRAVPLDAPRLLPAAVNAVVAGGRDLTGGPRFLLAGGARWRLVGVACQVADLGSTMDIHMGRPLYCFVGWFGHVTDPVPDLSQLRSRYGAWAAQPYERWVGLDWERHPVDLHEPHHPQPDLAPWDHEPAPAPPGGPTRALPSSAGSIICYPPKFADSIWRDLAGSTGDFTFTVGWPAVSDVSPDTGSHATVAELTDYPVIIRHERVTPPRQPPERESAPPPPERPSFGGVVRSLFSPRSAERPPAKEPRPKPAAREPSLPDVLRDSFTGKPPPDENNPR